MATQIVLNIDSQPGSMARVVAALRRFGLTLSKHRIEPVAEGVSRLVILVDGSFSPSELGEKLLAIKGVQQVVAIGAESGDTVTTARAEPGPKPQAMPDPAKLVDQILSSYPKILPLIEGYEHALGRATERGASLQDLGVKVGLGMMGDEAALKNATTIHEALQKAVVPALTPISDVEVTGSDVRAQISIFTRRQVNTMDLVFGGEANRCDFMTGLIQGMINASGSLPDVRVRELKCRTNGDDCCLFRVSA